MNKKAKKIYPSLSAPVVRTTNGSVLKNEVNQIQPSVAWICIYPPCDPFAGDNAQ